MPDALRQTAEPGRGRRHPARKTLREGYLHFDGTMLGTEAIVVQRQQLQSAAPMYERSQNYGARRSRADMGQRGVTDSSVRTRVEERQPEGPLRPGELRRKPKKLISKRHVEPGRPAVSTPGQPVQFTSRNAAGQTLDGSSLPPGQRPTVGEVRQWSGTVLRIFDTTTTGSTRHRVKFRLVAFYDGENVVRFSLFRDHDSARGFEPPSRYELNVHQAQVLPPSPDRPAEVHLRYEGQVWIDGKGTAVFDGMIIVRGDGRMVCTDPNIITGTGKGAVLRNAATVGWW